MRRRKKFWLILFGLLFLFGIWTEVTFNLRSNFLLYLQQDSKQDLLVLGQDSEWESVFTIGAKQVNEHLIWEYESPEFRWAKIRVHRTSDDRPSAFANSLIQSHLNLLIFSPDQFTYEAAFQPDFRPTSAKEIRKDGDYLFTLNASYFGPDKKPLGQIIHHSETVNPNFPHWTGYFFVKNGKAYFGPKSLYLETPGKTEELIQCYPSIMKNQKVFNYVHLKNNPYFDGNKKTYRGLAGMHIDGSVMFLLSGPGGFLDIRELASLAHKLNFSHATLFDGGSSLQYSLKYDGCHLNFAATSPDWDLKFIHPDLQKVRPPVFIGLKSPENP